MNKYFGLSAFLLLTVLLGNGCAIAGQRSHVTVYPSSDYNPSQYTQFYSYNSGNSASNVRLFVSDYFEDTMKVKSTIYSSKSVNKMLVACEGKDGAIFPPYFAHVELQFKSIYYAQVVLLDSMNKKPIMKCIYTRGIFCLAGGRAFTIMKKSLTEGFEKLKDVKLVREKDPNKRFPDELSFTVD